MYIEKLTRKSHQYNEDRFLIQKDFIMVMDGATSLIKSNLRPTSGSYLVNKVKNDLPKLKGDIETRLNIIAKDVYKTLELNNEMNSRILPSAGLSWVEFYQNEVVIHTIGDCEACVVTKDNKVIRIVISDLIELDNMAINELIEVSHKENISIKEARSKINDTLIKNRLLMNKENGYSIFAPSSSPNFKYSTNIFNKKEIKEIYLYSDGFADAFTTYKLYTSPEELFTKSVNIKNIVKEIVEKSKEDKSYNKYPRFKLIDDITIVKIIL